MKRNSFSPFDEILFRMKMGTCVAFMVCSFPVFAQDAGQAQGDQSSEAAAVEKPKSEEVVLPGAEVRAQRETAEHVSQEQMRERGDTNLFEAMRWVPGIVTNGGHAATDLGGLSLRGIGGGGHGTDYMTIMQDGTPLSDLGGFGTSGRIDYAGILTGGLESIDVAKGYTSVLLGPNIMAGVLMMRTAKPKKQLELDARAGFDFDAGGFAANTDTLTVGTRMGMFYARAGIQEKYVDHWRLPDSFKPGFSRPPEQGGDPQQAGNRIFTNSNALGVNLMFGVNPLENLDIWTTYAYSSRKLLPDGWAPPRAGDTTDLDADFETPLAETQTYVLMSAYPYRNRHDATLHAEWTAEKLNLGLNGYFNFYEQRSYSLTPASWGPTGTIWPYYLNKQYSISDLNAYAFGINLNGGYEINDMHKIEASFQFRQNDYETWSGSSYGVRVEPEHTDKYQTVSYVDNIYFGGVEYTVNPFKDFTGIAGLGLDMLDPQKLDRWSINRTTLERTKSNTDTSNFIAIPQWSLGVFYDLSEQHELHLTYAKKNRFPSFSERQGAQASSSQKPNMDLKPQQVHHFELGYKGYFLERIRLNSAIYTNYELNKIATVNLNNDPNYRTQKQNIDENLYYGFELGTEMFFNNYFTLGGSLAINKYKILHAEGKSETGNDFEYMGSAPLLVTNGYFGISPLAGKKLGVVDDIRIMPRFEYVGPRFAASDANLLSADERKYLDDYVLLHLGIFVDIAEHYSVSFAINNIMDQLYYTTDWIPGAGRSFNISLGAKF